MTTSLEWHQWHSEGENARSRVVLTLVASAFAISGTSYLRVRSRYEEVSLYGVGMTEDKEMLISARLKKQ